MQQLRHMAGDVETSEGKGMPRLAPSCGTGHHSAVLLKELAAPGVGGADVLVGAGVCGTMPKKRRLTVGGLAAWVLAGSASGMDRDLERGADSQHTATMQHGGSDSHCVKKSGSKQI